MPKKPKEIEKLILRDGWLLKAQVGSHRHYIHPIKKGKVTIPFHCRELPKGTENAILKQAGLK
ncbi:type II toxin-antitoxin system HicA family toxin [uncultured Eubacterium sp.]|uniref:type II toxin-antitoxin system HicA family toxin n=1 Tax=uncultured Eubacterium sp. TaxID=165185 RepID=UPI002671452D|nr:type II toxin-antitoxin system HicA family toxin [uncultured Eubacterium sp.]